MAHKGVLFLDELPEFPRHVLEVLREPLENGRISLSRANAQIDYPAEFQLVAALNPCPCGYYGDSKGRCRCTPQQVARYRDRISGPLLDRIDMHVPLHPLPIEQLQNKPDGEASLPVRERVRQTRERQQLRQSSTNAQLKGQALYQHCRLGDEEQKLLAEAMQRLQLSARAYDRIVRVARTIADMASAEQISPTHLAEALSYRNFDRSAGSVY